jgi:hypothetical protein
MYEGNGPHSPRHVAEVIDRLEPGDEVAIRSGPGIEQTTLFTGTVEGPLPDDDDPYLVEVVVDGTTYRITNPENKQHYAFVQQDDDGDDLLRIDLRA